MVREESAFPSFQILLTTPGTGRPAFGYPEGMAPQEKRSAHRGPPMAALTPDEVKARLASTPGWSLEQGELVRQFQFADFLGSIAFVNSVAQVAEAAGHHPDIDIRYNKVRLALTTHDAGGITAKDFDLAAKAGLLV